MIAVPPEFRPKEKKPYPSDNLIPFEEWFYLNYDSTRNKTGRVYLPILWTAYYVNNKHGRDHRALAKLQQYLNGLDKTKKYFTIVQYDDKILNNVSHLDLKVFGMGCKGDYQLPLVCQPHKYEFPDNGRPILASFIGAETHPIRTQMIKELSGKKDYFISTEPTSLHTYCYIMSQSRFVYCPRGYGKTSFRIMEALQYGATPIYLADDKDFLFINGCLLSDSVNMLLETFIQPDPAHNKSVYEKYYTFTAVANKVYENI